MESSPTQLLTGLAPAVPIVSPEISQQPQGKILTADDFEENVVYKTTAYDAFKRIKGNRPYDPVTLLQLRKAMMKKVLVAPILVNENFEIIDGQHRWLISKQLEVPIYFIMRRGYGHDQMVRFNINAKNWKMMDYLNLYVQRGYPDYIRLKEYIERYELSLSAGIFLLTNRLSASAATRGAVRGDNGKTVRLIEKVFEEGKFKVLTLDVIAEENARRLNELQKALLAVHLDAREYIHSDMFVRGFININRSPLYEHEKLIVKIDMSKPSYHGIIFDLARLPRRAEDYSLHLQKLYNHHAPRSVTLYVPFAERRNAKQAKTNLLNIFTNE